MQNWRRTGVAGHRGGVVGGPDTRREKVGLGVGRLQLPFLLGYRSPEELAALVKAELGFLESCLRVNPKSYGTWHHRCWLLSRLPEPNWARELELCARFLEADERNCTCPRKPRGSHILVLGPQSGEDYAGSSPSIHFGSAERDGGARCSLCSLHQGITRAL